MFRGIMGYESKKLFIKRNIIMLAGIFLLLSFLCWNGIRDYNLIQANKKPFQELERKKVSMLLHYTLYGVRGVRLLYIPKPISIIFNDSAVFPGMTAHLDTGEKLDISNSFKGKDLFSDSGGFMDFAGIMLLIASFLGLAYGWDGTRSPDYLKFISDISGCDKPGFLITLARIILLNLVSWLLAGLALAWLLINGINAANMFYLVYVMVLSLVIGFFVTLGAIMGSFKSKIIQFICMPLLYFLLVFFIPWLVLKGVYTEAQKGIQSIYEFEYETFEYLMNFEKKAYEKYGVWKSGKEAAPEDIKTMIKTSTESVYKQMQKLEDKRLGGILKRVRTYQTISAFLPTTFYISSNKELSSKGFQNFVDFYGYAYDMKFKFVDFYLYRKFWMPLPKSGVEPFIKGDEDLYYGKSQLPTSFLLGIIITLFHLAVLLIVLHRVQKKVTGVGKNEQEKPLTPVDVDFKQGNTLLALCKNQQIKGEVSRYYRGQRNTVCIDKIPVNIQHQLNGLKGIDAGAVLKYLCILSGVNREKAVEYLKVLGIHDLNRVELTREEILKFYAVLKSAKDIEYIVLDDFFKNEPREFENDLFKFLGFLEESGKKILYLSCDMYYPKDKNKINEKINGHIETFCIIPLPIDSVTLR
jgi:hypothetical protein